MDEQDSLQNETEEYWAIATECQRQLERECDLNQRTKLRKELNSLIVERYINHLLPKEIDWSKRQNCWPDGHLRADILVLLLGYAVEPLLQSICAWQPRQVLFLPSASYGDVSSSQFARQRKHIIEKLNGSQIAPKPFPEFPQLRDELHCDLPVPDDESPGTIFRYLMDQLGSDLKRPAASRPRIIVDITGGKKSMVAGAYLFAAFTGVNISYVDFEVYSPGFHQPYGYSCKIGLQSNPYKDFTLHEWGRVRELYERRTFDTAAQQLDEILSAMDPELFTGEQRGAVQTMYDALRYVHAWSGGDYRSAYRLGKALESTTDKPWLPDTIGRLHGKWPGGASSSTGGTAEIDFCSSVESQIKELEETLYEWFYADLDRVLAYARDEAIRVEHLVQSKEDYRSGLLRAAGLNECLLRARLYGPLSSERLKMIRDNVCLDAHAATRVIRSVKNSEQLERLLKGIVVKLDKRRYQLEWASTDPEPVDFDDETWNRLAVLRRLRNKVIHATMPVSQQIAQGALSVMWANVGDFERFCHSTSADPTPDPFPPSWSTLCDRCGVDFLFLPDVQETKA